jgi:hypothetical protein
MATFTPARAVLGSVSANWPSARLSVGSTVSVSGHVSGLALGNGVVLQQKVPGGWRNMSKARLDGNRNYRLTIPTWWLGSRSYRVITTSLLNTIIVGTPSAPWAVDVVPRYTPAGSSTQYHYSTSARWDPCRTIGYRVNAAQTPSGAITDVKGAIDRLSQATGLSFVYRGTTTGIPQSGTNGWYPADTQIVVAWARPSQSSMLRLYSGAVGVGAAISSVSRIIRGAVVLNSGHSYPAGFGPGKTRGDLVLHELGHAMGLGHIGASTQIMYPVLTPGLARLGLGDLTGLERRGARLGCVGGPAARTGAPVVTALP